jgi:hypothetical protein
MPFGFNFSNHFKFLKMQMTVAHLQTADGENPMGDQPQGIVVDMIPKFKKAQAAAHVKKIEVKEVKKDPPVRHRTPEDVIGWL